MEITYQPQDVPQQKFFSTTVKPPMRRLYCYVEPAIYDEIAQIAQSEGLEFSATTRELIALALRYYKFKRGTLNQEKPENSKTFFCQSCNRETNIRKVIYKQVDFDEYRICEQCAFDPVFLERFTSKILKGMTR